MSQADLLELMDQVKKHLPPLRLAEINLEEEIMAQYVTVRELQTASINDDDFPLNQRAQVANSVTGALQKLTELQERMYSTERYKAIENLLISCLREWPEEDAANFLDRYEKILESIE